MRSTVFFRLQTAGAFSPRTSEPVAAPCLPAEKQAQNVHIRPDYNMLPAVKIDPAVAAGIDPLYPGGGRGQPFPEASTLPEKNPLAGEQFPPAGPAAGKTA